MRRRHASQLAGPEHRPQDLSTSQGSLMFNDVKSTPSSRLSPKEPPRTKAIMIS